MTPATAEALKEDYFTEALEQADISTDNNTISLMDFMKTFAPQLEKRVELTMKPLYTPQNDDDDFNSMVKPFAVQREVVKAATAGYKAGENALWLVGEMGSGKTLTGIWIAHNTHAKRTLVICPPHLVKQWEDEIHNAYPYKKTAIIPNQKLKKLGISNMRVIQEIHRQKNMDFVIISKEAIKTELPWQKITPYNKIKKEYVCPSCYTELDYETVLDAHKAKKTCPLCRSALFQYKRDKTYIDNKKINEFFNNDLTLDSNQPAQNNRFKPSIAKYIHKKMKGFFDFVIFDEVHELKAEDTAQGAVLGKLGGNIRSLSMTGTLMGGKASDIFYLLYRTKARAMKAEGLDYNQCNTFVSRFGVLEKRQKVEDEDNVQSIGKKRTGETLKERPGLSPLVVGKFLIDSTVFLRLSDFAEKLPYFNEEPIGCKLHPEIQLNYASLMTYKDFLRSANRPAKIVSSAIQAMLRYPDTASIDKEEICDINKDGEVEPLIIVPEIELPLGATEKEQRLIDIVSKAKQDGNKVLIYTTQTKKRDIQPRIQKLLDEAWIQSAVMSHSVSTDKRSAWIKAKTLQTDALICHPRLVATGFNLLEFPVIIFFDTGYSTYILRQASRRSYRINQIRDQIDVYYLYTTDTIQQDCLSLMAAKNEVSLMAEGEIQEGGLSVLSDAAGSIISELTKVINGELKTENPLEVFSRLNKFNNEGKNRKASNKPEEIMLPGKKINKASPFASGYTHKAEQISLFL